MLRSCLHSLCVKYQSKLLRGYQCLRTCARRMFSQASQEVCKRGRTSCNTPPALSPDPICLLVLCDQLQASPAVMPAGAT